MIPGALGLAPLAALPLPAGAAASSCSCSCSRPPGPSPPGSEPADPDPRFPAPGAPPHANHALPAPLPSRAERRRGGSGTPGSGERKRGRGAPGSGSPGPRSGPGSSPSAPGSAGSAWFPKRLRLTSASRSPRPLPAQGARSCLGALTQEPEATSCPASPRPVTGRCPRRPRVGAGQGRAGGAGFAQGWEPVRSPAAVGQCLFCLAAEDTPSSLCSAPDVHRPFLFLSFHDLE